MESEIENPIIGCYCENSVSDPYILTCINCKKQFHISCLKSGRPSDLVGDIYFKFTCINCSADGNEIFERAKLPWTTVLMLSLYNLQIQGGGKCGYFRWREHVCRFIDKNWTSFFGATRSKSATWHGTVAGCLSNGANRFFMSGVEVLGENGWWALKSSKLPTLEEIDSARLNVKAPRRRKTEEASLKIEGPRRKKPNVIDAAKALKESKECIVGDVRPKSKKKRNYPNSSKFLPNHKIKLIVPKLELGLSADSSDVPRAIPKIIIKTERSVSPKLSDDSDNPWMKGSDDMDLGFQDLPDVFDFSNPLDSSNTFNSLLEDVYSEISCDKTSIKSSPRYESEEENSNLGKSVSSKKVQHIDISKKKKAVTKDESLVIKETVTAEPKYTLMSTYDEDQLLLKLENYPNTMKQRPEIRCLYRKLVVRKLKRARNIPLFDIDAEVRSIRGMDPPDYCEKGDLNKRIIASSNTNILDCYQMSSRNLRNKSQHSSFITRLMGLEDDQLESIISPYTERILKPFIFRDYSTKPLKLQLLEEVINHTNKSNPNFVPPKQSPIDYCYVRPQHIPAINALCQEFFWPGIDLSESLQYPDFSCVALYRKVIIGFAFMVPDVKYNEAYITFIFCHPEWRHAGIATFMLYHLIQTCMGKDVTLHVSATSSAVFLYQKFGFKIEDFIHDFYDKYLPPESKECRHALFLRLSR